MCKRTSDHKVPGGAFRGKLQTMSNAALTQLFEHKAWANRAFYAALLELPQERRKEIVVPIFTLDHASRVDTVFRARLEGNPEPLETVIAQKMPKLEELAQTVAGNDEWYVNYVKTTAEAELNEPVEFQFLSDEDKGHMTRAQILAHVLTHSHSHRTAMTQKMADLGIKFPGDMVTTWVSSGHST
jgi:uncharacterized damage-inducible protein DinB